MATTDFNNFNAAEDEPNPVNIIKPVAGNVGLLPRPMSEADHDYYQTLLGVSLTSGAGDGSGFSRKLVTNGDIAGFLKELGSQSQAGLHFATGTGTESIAGGAEATIIQEEEEKTHANEENEEGK